MYAGEALEWELRTLDEVFHDHESLYRGSARPELDEAWQKLMKGLLSPPSTPRLLDLVNKRQAMTYEYHIQDGPLPPLPTSLWYD